MTTQPWLQHYPPGVDWHAPLQPQPMAAMFADSVARFADRPCLDFLDRHYSYAEVGDLVDRAAAGLQELGVTKGTRVGLFLPNTPYYVIMFYAVLRIGGGVVGF